MAATALKQMNRATKAFPAAQVESRLRQELGKAAAESAILRGDWEPVLDSLRMVSAVISLEDICDFDLPPEKLVRKGGYSSVEEGVADMRDRLRDCWNEHYKMED